MRLKIHLNKQTLTFPRVRGGPHAGGGTPPRNRCVWGIGPPDVVAHQAFAAVVETPGVIASTRWLLITWYGEPWME